MRRLIQDNARWRTFSIFFKTNWFLDLMITDFENTASHKHLVQKAKRLWMAWSEITGHSFFVLIEKWHKLCFENSSSKLLSSNNFANSSWAWQVCRLPKYQLCVVCWSNFSWIESPKYLWNYAWSFNFSLKLLSVLWKVLT